MKNTAINSFGYTGTVTLSQYIGGKKVKLCQLHNTGKNALFNFISDCLVGDFDTAKMNRPTKIMLLQEKETIDTTTQVKSIDYERKSGFIYQLSKPEKIYTANPESVVCYSFIIPSDMFAAASIDFSHIGLYTNATIEAEFRQFAAIVDIRNQISQQAVSASSALLIDWELNISNK